MATKVWLKKQNIAFTERNVSKDKDAASYLRSMGFRVTPVTEIEGEMIVGYSVSKLKESAERNGLL